MKYNPDELIYEARAFKEEMRNGQGALFALFTDNYMVQDGEGPQEYWARIKKDFTMLTPEDKNIILEQLVESQVHMLAYLHTLMEHLESLGNIVKIMAESTIKYENDCYESRMNISELWSMIDHHQRELVNASRKTPSFAIISGGSNDERNIPGCEQPNTSTTGEGGEGITKDSS